MQPQDRAHAFPDVVHEAIKEYIVAGCTAVLVLHLHYTMGSLYLQIDYNRLNIFGKMMKTYHKRIVEWRWQIDYKIIDLSNEQHISSWRMIVQI